MEYLKNKVIISLAPVAGSGPLVPEQLVDDVVRSIDMGASMCHLHCKRRDGRLTDDTAVMTQAFDLITGQRDVVVQVSTGGISDMNIEQRCRPLAYEKTETASLNGGSTNLGEAIYKNSFDDIRYCADICYRKGILPEIEVFDIGMIHNVEMVRSEQPFTDPLLFNLVFGHRGGMQATIESLMAFRSFVPKDALWGVTHFGRDNWTFLAAAIAMGASLVRIGLEDSNYLGENQTTRNNYELVERLVTLIRAMGLEAASPADVRKKLGLPGKEQR